MAKKAEQDNEGGGVTRWEGHEAPETPTRYEFTHFLKDKHGAKACLKASGDANVFDDTAVVLEGLYAQGYVPDSWGQSTQASQTPAQNGNGTQAQGEKPTKFQDQQGETWYINQSKKKAGSYYAARKNKATGMYEYCPKDQIPSFVREAYGASLS